MNLKMAPSLMSMDLLDVRKSITTLNTRADFYHVDILDWHYVKNMCLTPHFIEAIRPITDVPIEAHLYVDNLEADLVQLCLDAGANIITMPSDIIDRQVYRLANLIHQQGASFGVFLNPSQPISTIAPYGELLDQLILMNVDPGFSNQKMIPRAYTRITEAKTLRDSNDWHYQITVDGNCNENNFEKLAVAGVDAYVLGRGLFGRNTDLSQAAEDTYFDLRQIEKRYQ